MSRESSFLFNNLILLASCFAILWGTLFPVIMEALTNEKETIDSPYYLKVEVPIGLFLLFLTGVGPLIAWRRSSLDSLRRAFLIPTIVAVLVAVELIRGRRSTSGGCHIFRSLRVCYYHNFVASSGKAPARSRPRKRFRCRTRRLS